MIYYWWAILVDRVEVFHIFNYKIVNFIENNGKGGAQYCQMNTPFLPILTNTSQFSIPLLFNHQIISMCSFLFISEYSLYVIVQSDNVLSVMPWYENIHTCLYNS